MHDPSTVAWSIKFPWRRGGGKFDLREPFITIWHVDPEREGYHGNRPDDSCGWTTPPITEAERDGIYKLGKEQFFDLFRQRDQISKGDPEGYAYVCYEPSTYDAIYWAWWQIKWETGGKFRRRRLRGGRGLSKGELSEIYTLASNPIDNLQVLIAGIKSEEDCGSFFVRLYKLYRCYHRPWWQHPRFHFWHFRFQIHPWQKLRRHLFDRCAHCGKPFIGESPVSHSWDDKTAPWFGSRPGLYHSLCSNEVRSHDREETHQGLPGGRVTESRPSGYVH